MTLFRCDLCKDRNCILERISCPLFLHADYDMRVGFFDPHTDKKFYRDLSGFENRSDIVSVHIEPNTPIPVIHVSTGLKQYPADQGKRTAGPFHHFFYLTQMLDIDVSLRGLTDSTFFRYKDQLYLARCTAGPCNNREEEGIYPGSDQYAEMTKALSLYYRLSNQYAFFRWAQNPIMNRAIIMKAGRDSEDPDDNGAVFDPAIDSDFSVVLTVRTQGDRFFQNMSGCSDIASNKFHSIRYEKCCKQRSRLIVCNTICKHSVYLEGSTDCEWSYFRSFKASCLDWEEVILIADAVDSFNEKFSPYVEYEV